MANTRLSRTVGGIITKSGKWLNGVTTRLWKVAAQQGELGSPEQIKKEADQATAYVTSAVQKAQEEISATSQSGGHPGEKGKTDAATIAKDVIGFLPAFVKFFYRVMMDPSIDARAKAVVALSLVYIISPVDVIPDAMLPFGFVDDAGVAVTIFQALPKLINPQTIQRHWPDSAEATRKIVEAISQLQLGSVVAKATATLKKQAERS